MLFIAYIHIKIYVFNTEKSKLITPYLFKILTSMSIKAAGQKLLLVYKETNVKDTSCYFVANCF